jgi:putative transcription antitermination factor YqgF
MFKTGYRLRCNGTASVIGDSTMRGSGAGGCNRVTHRRHQECQQEFSVLEPSRMLFYTAACFFWIYCSTTCHAWTMLSHHRVSQRQTPTSSTHRRFLSLSPSFSTSDERLSRAIEDAAASFTQEACPLLGVKSVGVDYGLVRTGVAVTVGYNPKPLDILVWDPPKRDNDKDEDDDREDDEDDVEDYRRFPRYGNNRRRRGKKFNNTPDTLPGNTTQIALQVVEIAQRELADQIIVGLPLHKNGTEAEQSNHTRVFAAELSEHVLKSMGPNVPVYLWDERYSSKEAAARAHSKDPNRFLYGTLDAEAACIILEHYYSASGQGAEQVVVKDMELVQKYTNEWERRVRLEEERLRQEEMARNDRLRWRKEAMLRDQMAMQQQQQEDGENPNKKKKKRKRKK